MLKIHTIVVTPYQQNARILIDDETNDCVIVDPGGDIPLILQQLPVDTQVKAIWVTHSHIDHVSGVALLLSELAKNNCNPDVIAHSDDSINREHLPIQSQMMQFPYSGDFEVTHTVSDSDIISIGRYNFRVLHTPGHAIGHIGFYCDQLTNQFEAPVLIAGDALFKGSIGRTDLPGGNHQQLLDSIQSKLLVLPDETVVCSGHGSNTLIGDERGSNPFLI